MMMRRRAMMAANQRPYGWLYRFDGSIASSGTKDFGFAGVENYVSGFDGSAYYHEVNPEGGTAATSDRLGIKAAPSILPDMSGDWTIAMWHKSLSEKRGHLFAATQYYGSGDFTTYGNPLNVKSGWTVTTSAASKAIVGIQLGYISQKLNVRITTDGATNKGRTYVCAPPSSFSSLVFHHYAITYSQVTNMIYVFVDGKKIFDLTANGTIAFGRNVGVGNYFGTTSAAQDDLTATSFSDIVDDLYISDQTCKWTSDFDPYAISY